MSLFSRSARPRTGLFVTLAASMLLLAACSSGASSASPSAAASCAKPDASGVVKVSAKEMAFDTSCIEVPADTAFKIEFNNQDSIPHDIAAYTDSSKGEELFRGEVVQGPKTVTYDVPALKAGEHYFECTIHPSMNGKIVAQ